MLECKCKSTGHNIDTEQEATATNRNRKGIRKEGHEIGRYAGLIRSGIHRNAVASLDWIGKSAPVPLLLKVLRPCSRTVHTHTHTHTHARTHARTQTRTHADTAGTAGTAGTADTQTRKTRASGITHSAFHIRFGMPSKPRRQVQQSMDADLKQIMCSVPAINTQPGHVQ